jgi:large subunit ribosomal protein L5
MNSHVKTIVSTNLRFYEDFIYNYYLNSLSKFNIINTFSIKQCLKISLNFGFKSIKFEKKKMVLFFLCLELITNQKCMLTNSKKALIFLKIKRGSITGCKLTLRKSNLFDFLDNLLLSLPRSETFKGFFYNIHTKKQNNFSTKISNLFIFYPLESELMPYIKTLDISFSFNTINDFEKFYSLSSFKIPLYVQ